MPVSNHDLGMHLLNLSQTIFASKVNSIDKFAKQVLRSKKRTTRKAIKALGRHYFETTLALKGNKLNPMLEVDTAKLTAA